MEMLKLLTQKFRQQSLNEGQPFQPPEVDDRDSGTESDEENAELQAIEEAMQADQEDQENQHQGQHGVMILTASPFQSPPRSSSSPVSSMSKRPFSQLVNNTNSPFQTLSGQHADLNSHISGHYSPQGSSDFERCSLDYEPSSSTEFDRHSSEEELSVINFNTNNRELHSSEKRKWSQVNNHCGSCNESSGSSDEEVRDFLSSPIVMKPIVMKPLNFSSSPPRGVQKLSRTLSPKLFLANVAPTTVRVCSVSPRKRHRQSSSTDVSDATVIQRPCLDFEKMQKTLMRRCHNGINKARIVKIRSFNGTTRPPKCLYDPSIFSFRSISLTTAYSSLTPLTPVEEPSCAF